MNKQTSPSGSSTSASGERPGASMSTRYADFTALARKSGVTRILAFYDAEGLVIRFMDVAGKTMFPADWTPERVLQLSNIFGVALQSHCPTWSEDDGSHGTFTWDILKDTLEHQHTVTYQGP